MLMSNLSLCDRTILDRPAGIRHSVFEAFREGVAMAAEGRFKKLLGELMLEKGLITSAQLRDALREQERSHEKLGRVLIDLGYVSELDMFRCVSEQFGLPFPPRFLPYFRRKRGQPTPVDAFAAGRTRASP
jgi:hypothetical protein